MANQESNESRCSDCRCLCFSADVSPTSQALCDEVVTVLTVFCEKLESVDR